MGGKATLTDLQVEMMRVLWREGEASVAQVCDALRLTRRLAQPTVATLLARLEKKGVVAHRTEGRHFVYRATVSEAEVRRSMVAQLADTLFGGNVPLLVHQLLSSDEVSSGDLERVKEMIEAREREITAAGTPRRGQGRSR